MRKLHLPFLFAALILTSCNVNNSSIKEDNSSQNKEEVVLKEEEEIKEESPVLEEEPATEVTHIEEPVEEAQPEEEQVVVEEEIIEEEPPVVEEETVQVEETALISPIYRTGGTTSTTTLNLDVRSYEATITDTGRVHQKMDIVYLDYNYGGLNDLGYYWLEVIVTLTAREVHDGYQYLFLYNTSECQSSAESLIENFIPKAGDSIKQGMLFKEQFEIGPGYKKTSWEERSFRFYVPVGNMVDNLYLRYGANGILSDTWVNKDIRVSVTPKVTKN